MKATGLKRLFCIKAPLISLKIRYPVDSERIGKGITMIEDTLEKIEARIKNSKTISEEKRRELQELLGKLRNEVSNLAETRPEQAESITRLTDISTSEATRRDEKNRTVLNESLGGLEKSVKEFEDSHPQLVQVVNTISSTLANLGI
jgi:chromosome segregation ATPase